MLNQGKKFLFQLEAHSRIIKQLEIPKFFISSQVKELKNQGIKLYKEKKYDDSFNVLTEALKKLKKEEIVDELEEVADIHKHLGIILHNEGKLNEAIQEYQNAINLFSAGQQETSEQVATCYNNIGEAYNTLGKPKEALEYFEKGLNIDLKIFKHDHPYLAASYHNMGFNLFSQGKIDDSLNYFKKSLDIKLLHKGDSHTDLIDSYNFLARSNSEKGNVDEALNYANMALNIKGSETHPDILETRLILADLLVLKGKYSEALENLKKGAQIAEDMYGTTDQITSNLKLEIQALNHVCNLNMKK